MMIWPPRRVSGVLLLGLMLAAGCGPNSDPVSASEARTTRGEMSTPAGPVVTVSTSAELEQALAGLGSDATVELMAGTYEVPGEAFFLPEGRHNVTISGATGRRDDVIVRGGRFGFSANNVTGLTIRDLTITGASKHGVVLNCKAHAPVLRNLVLRDIGDQFVKANPGPNGCGVDLGVVEGSLFEYTNGAPDTYTNGVDVHFGAGWIIRGNTFRGFNAPSGLVGPAVLMWNGSRDTVVEDNTFVDNARDISLGLDPGKTFRPPVSDPGRTDHRGGRITRNTITRRAGLPGADVGVLVADSPDTRVEGNVITMNGTYPHAIEYRFPRTTGVVIANNTVDAPIVARDGATGTVTHALYADASP